MWGRLSCLPDVVGKWARMPALFEWKPEKTVGLLIGVLVLAGAVGAAIVYQDDFSGAKGVAWTSSTPEISPAGFEQKGWNTGLDGSGHLESTLPANSSPGYRVKLGTNPLTDDASITEISYTVTMRMPTNDWVMVGFQE